MRTFDDLPEWVPGMPVRITVTRDDLEELKATANLSGTLAGLLVAVSMQREQAPEMSFGEWLAKNSGPIDWSRQRMKL